MPFDDLDDPDVWIAQGSMPGILPEVAVDPHESIGWKVQGTVLVMDVPKL